MNEQRENSAIELHDSVIGHVSRAFGGIQIGLTPAYIHRSAGVPGVDPGTGWIQDVVIMIQDGRTENDIPELPCDLTNGTLDLGDATSENVLPLPLDKTGVVVLRLVPMWHQGEIVFRGSRISVSTLGAAEYVEPSPGSR